MFDIQNIYNSTPPNMPRRPGIQRPRRLFLFDLKIAGLGVGQELMTEHRNVPHMRMSPTGTLTSDVGNSQFFAKYGIRPIHDSTENILDSSESVSQACKITRLYDDNIKFPKLDECAHFHYDFVELGQVQVAVSDENQENVYRPVEASGLPEVSFFLRVRSNEKSWTVRRTFSDLCSFDKQLHRCIYDRNYSLLRELHSQADISESDIPELRKTMSVYLRRFSAIAGNMINCGPILSWLEMDNRGNRLIVTDDSAINTPAVSAAHAIRRYSAKALDEISFKVGDIISIIDMPPSDESSWWRGKHGFEVGFFPSDTVEVISERVPQSVSSKIPQTPLKPVLRKRGKLISFLRTFFTSRPTRATLKRTGIMKERVFGCDLGEHLLNSGHDVPLVLKSCAEVIESEGVVDGIYRLSGVASNIHRLRNEFDEDRVPDLEAEVYQQDIHSISSLVKMYFRELPNPLLTYQLYDKFAEAVQHDDCTKLAKLHDVIQQLPPPHYRTAEYLLRHLSTIAAEGVRTGMHCKNLAIVWAPNLLRSKELEQSCTTAALQGVGIQAIVTECLIAYVDVLFNSSLHAGNTDSAGCGRPKSLAISTPTRLLSLEEARERALSVGVGRGSPKQKYIEVGGGTATLPAQYHTVIDLPNKKKRKKSPNSANSGWRGLFNRGKAPAARGRTRNLSCGTGSEYPGEHRLMKEGSVLLDDDVSKRRRLRPVRSCDSLHSAATTPVRRSGGQAMPGPALDGASGTGVRSKSCDTSYEYELEYQDHSLLTDEGEVFTQPTPRQPFPSDVFRHDTSAVAVVMATDATAPKTNFMSELEEKLHSRTASIDSRSHWRPLSSECLHGDLETAAEDQQNRNLPVNFALRALASSPTSFPRSQLPAPPARPTSYDNMIYDVPKDLFAPGDGHLMPSGWMSKTLATTDSPNTASVNDGSSTFQGPSDVQPEQTSRFDDMHMAGVEGAACELALYEGSLAEDSFHGNSAANTDSDSEFERREAPSCSDDFSADIFSCLQKREVTKDAFSNVERDSRVESIAEHGLPSGVEACHAMNRPYGPVDVATEDMSPSDPSRQFLEQHPTEYVAHEADTGDMPGAVDTVTYDMARSTEDMTPASDVSRSLDSVLEEAGGGSLYTLAADAESCGYVPVTLGVAAGQCHGSASSIDSDTVHLTHRHDDTLLSSPPGFSDNRRRSPVDEPSYEPPVKEDDASMFSLNHTNETSLEGRMEDIDKPLLGSGCSPASFAQGVLDGYLYTGGNQIEFSDDEVEYVDPWVRHDIAEEETTVDEEITAEDETMTRTEHDVSPPSEFTSQPDDVLLDAPSYYDLYVARSTPAVPASHAPSSSHASPPAPLSPQAERGHIVIRRPAEGTVQQVQATRVKPAISDTTTTPPLPAMQDDTISPLPSDTMQPLPSALDSCRGDIPLDPSPTYGAASGFHPAESVSTAFPSAADSIEDKKPVGSLDRGHGVKKHSSQIGSSRFGERISKQDTDESERPQVGSSGDEIESTAGEEATFIMRAAKDEYTPSVGVKRKKSVRELLSQFEKGKSAAERIRQTCETVHESADKAPVVLVRPSGNVRASVDWSSALVGDATRPCRDEELRWSEERTVKAGSPPRCARRSSLSFQQRFKQFESQQATPATSHQLDDVACVTSSQSSEEKDIGRGHARHVQESGGGSFECSDGTTVDEVKPAPRPRSRVYDCRKKPNVIDTKGPLSVARTPSTRVVETKSSSEDKSKPSFCPPKTPSSALITAADTNLPKCCVQTEAHLSEPVRSPGLKMIIIEELKKPETERISLLTEAERPKSLCERLQLFESGHCESQGKMGEVGRKGPKDDVSVSVRGLSEKFERRASMRRSTHAGSSSSPDSDGGSPSASTANKRLLGGGVDLAKPCGIAL